MRSDQSGAAASRCRKPSNNLRTARSSKPQAVTRRETAARQGDALGRVSRDGGVPVQHVALGLPAASSQTGKRPTAGSDQGGAS
jgi:hypothetical protein